MKGKKYKRSQHHMHTIYCPHFLFRPPYQLLVDSDFCKELLKWKINPKDTLPVVFGNVVKPMITTCTLEDLNRIKDGDMSGAVFIGRRMEQRNCRHTKTKSPEECIKDLISSDNPHHYAVAAQMHELKRDLRKIPGVPLIYIQRGIVVMEAPSRQTMVEVAKREEAKFGIPEADKKAIQAIAPVEVFVNPEKRKRKPKVPNPLSVKKPKRKLNESKKIKDITQKANVRPRRRKRTELTTLEAPQ